MRRSLLLLALSLTPAVASSQSAQSTWTFAVSGDSRNCGDFVMPAIAAHVKAEHDAFYWHLGDFRWMSSEDQDLISLDPKLTKSEYPGRAWDDFLEHQMAAFGDFPVFLGRGNHETVPPMTREGYISKFSSFLNRPEIAAQRKSDGDTGPAQPWYHFTRDGVDFITLDNSSHDEFSPAQLHWLRSVLDRDLDRRSSIHTIIAGMHEALPHSTNSNHAMDDWDHGLRTGELVYKWFADAEASGKHVYIIASHSHYYSPNIYDTPYWKQHGPRILQGWIIGTAGAHRYKLSPNAGPGSITDIYGYLQGAVHPDGTVDFNLHKFSENDLKDARWPNASLDAIHECYIANSDSAGR